MRLSKFADAVAEHPVEHQIVRNGRISARVVEYHHMEIHALTIQLTDSDLVDLAKRALHNQDQVTDVQVHITSEGIRVAGCYRLMFRVSFETLWSLGVQTGTLTIALTDLKAGGFSAALFKGVLMSMIESEVEKVPGVTVDGHAIRLDPDRIAAAQGLNLRTNLSGVLCCDGAIEFLCELVSGVESKAA
jgi:hypothetical protein